jgi:simple sugar transport system permease protein
MMNESALFLQTAILMGTPMLFGSLGEILAEKAGHLNLGVEGMMMIGAVSGFLAGLVSEDPLLAMAAAVGAGAAGALIYAVLSITFRANQIVAGFVLTIFLTGAANLIGSNYGNQTLPSAFTGQFKAVPLPGLSEIPLVGIALFQQSWLVYLSILFAVLLWVYLTKTRFGLALRMVGENPAAADESGIPVTLYKYVHVLAGGGLCGIGGASITLLLLSRWQESVTAGMGWIAIALVIFSTWRPFRAALGAWFFGAMRGIPLKFQNAPIAFFGVHMQIPAQILDLLPYVMTIVVLILITLGRKRENQAPGWLGRAYFREER